MLLNPTVTCMNSLDLYPEMQLDMTSHQSTKRPSLTRWTTKSLTVLVARSQTAVKTVRIYLNKTIDENVCLECTSKL